MTYYIDENASNLDALQKRLQTTDLIPSQEPLLDGLAAKMISLGAAGVVSLADLRCALKTEKSLIELARESSVDAGYLRLLRRTINGFFPKPRPLKEIDWLGADTIQYLEKAGIKNTRQYFDAASGGITALANQTGINLMDAKEILAISDLCRIQWVSPTFARVIIAAGNARAQAVAKENPAALFGALKKANKDALFYKGTVGLRDVRRLVKAAKYVP